MSQTTSVEVLADCHAALGEGPTWDATTDTLRWVDIDRGRLWAMPWVDGRSGSPVLTLEVGPTLGAAVPAEDGGILLARTRHLEHRKTAGQVISSIQVIPNGVASRLNDGACDPAGRYLIGSLALDSRTDSERLWRLEHDGTLTVIDDDLALSNGIAWNPDGTVMYHVDTLRHRVYVRDYQSATGKVGARDVLIESPGEFPDGLCVDAFGDFWVAYWAAGEVRQIAPDGTVRDILPTEAPLTTSCAFIGEKLELLAITTAGKPDATVANTARSGAVLVAAPGVHGRACTRWRPTALGQR